MQETIICAQCGSSNPRTNKFCGECGAALAASSTIEPGFPGHATAAAAVSDDQLPDWLRESAAAADEAEHTGAPEWLRETSAPESSLAESDLPDWLRGAA